MRDQSIQLLCIGINHHTANVDLQEQLAFTPHRLETSLACLGCANGNSSRGIQELVNLSTCNRVELYAVTDYRGFDLLKTFFPNVKISLSKYFHLTFIAMKMTGLFNICWKLPPAWIPL